nr:hypothetical protein [Aeromonas veronii]
METQTLYRGRLIDHIQLVVKDLAASQRFYTATLASLDIPLGGTGEGYFWADELFVTVVDSPAALGGVDRSPPPRLSGKRSRHGGSLLSGRTGQWRQR